MLHVRVGAEPDPFCREEKETMQYRQLGRTGWKVSDISFGAWAIGGAWGSVSDDESLTALHQAMSQFALRWILMFDAVTCAIPGDKRAEQVADNCQASDLPPLSDVVMTPVRRIYDEKVRPLVHYRW